MSVKRLVPLHAVVLDVDPITGRLGDIYFNSLDNELKFFDGTNWLPVGGAITGLLEHTHTYDGNVFSVEANEIPNSGIIDGGNP